MVTCPLCDADLDMQADELSEGEELTCTECGASLTVLSTDPLELDALDDEEDEEEDYDFDEDEEDEEEEEEEWK